MIPMPSGVRVWIAAGHTDMRRGMQGLAFRFRRVEARSAWRRSLYLPRASGRLAKILWHDGIGLSLYAKRLDRGKFIWPSAKAGVVSISAAQMAYMLEGIDWRNPQMTWRPKSAGLSAMRKAPAERRKTLDHAHFRAPQIAKIMIPFVVWTRLRRSSRRRRRSESGA